jgi:nucleoside-diphosphate-sugar epimerase
MVMRVFVAGGTGVLGRPLVPQLVARGHQVTATTTSAAKLGLVDVAGLPDPVQQEPRSGATMTPRGDRYG